MKKILIITGIIIFTLIGCNNKPENEENSIVVTNYPAKMIIKEIVSNSIKVESLLRPGDSPHTYSPKPSDASKTENAKLFVYIADNLDSWVTKYDNPNKIELIKLVPKGNLIYFSDAHQHENDDDEIAHEGHSHNDGAADPHFWLDPLTVKAILPSLQTEIIKAFPEKKNLIENNIQLFSKKLDNIHNTIEKELKKVKGKYVFTFHPSFEYFIKRYGLISGGSLEVVPGKEPSPNYIKHLSDLIKLTKTKTIFSEPQFPKKTAESIAAMTNTKLEVLDPIGGVKNIITYYDLLFFNTRVLKKSL